jgi:hypothetical protein
MSKEELTVWVDTDYVSKLEKIKGFIPVFLYEQLQNINPYEWGMVEQEDLIIRYRATSFVRYVKQIFVG